jgi:hypothetical protein
MRKNLRTEGIPMADVTLNINLDAKCVECGKPGATPSELCLKCCTKAMDPKAAMKTRQGKALQARLAEGFKRARAANSGETK